MAVAPIMPAPKWPVFRRITISSNERTMRRDQISPAFYSGVGRQVYCCLDFPLCFTFVLLLLFLFCSYFPILLLCPCSCLKHVVQYWIGVRGLLGVSWSPTIFPEPLSFCYYHLLPLPCPVTMSRLRVTYHHLTGLAWGPLIQNSMAAPA